MMLQEYIKANYEKTDEDDTLEFKYPNVFGDSMYIRLTDNVLACYIQGVKLNYPRLSDADAFVHLKYAEFEHMKPKLFPYLVNREEIEFLKYWNEVDDGDRYSYECKEKNIQGETIKVWFYKKDFIDTLGARISIDGVLERELNIPKYMQAERYAEEVLYLMYWHIRLNPCKFECLDLQKFTPLIPKFDVTFEELKHKNNYNLILGLKKWEVYENEDDAPLLWYSNKCVYNQKDVVFDEVKITDVIQKILDSEVAITTIDKFEHSPYLKQ